MANQPFTTFNEQCEQRGLKIIIITFSVMKSFEKTCMYGFMAIQSYYRSYFIKGLICNWAAK